MKPLFPDFLMEKSEYLLAEDYWKRLWDRIPSFDKRVFGWHEPWFKESPISNEGNPIFTAFSESQGKAIRIIQYKPTTSHLELDWWLDTFGGSATNPNAIRELVISCALSVESAQVALELIASWVVGPIEIAASRKAKTTEQDHYLSEAA